jgi:hypothetical protein
MTANEFRIKECMSISQDIDNSDIEFLMIEFAKYHVEQALKTASKSVDYRLRENHLDLHMFDDSFEVDPNSILNAYPLENIK